MREILFRGKRTDNGEWVYGDLMNEVFEFVTVIRRGCEHNGKKRYLLDEVIPETVGQYTGLTTNGKKIFEGDIVKDIAGRIKAVEFYKGRYYPFIAFPDYTCWDEDEAEVIGNIHDNHELLKGGAE